MRLAFLVLAAVVLASCSRSSLRISGNMSNVPDGEVVVVNYDSCFMPQEIGRFHIQDGSFEFDSGVSVEGAECISFMQNNYHLLTLFVGNEDVRVEGNVLNLKDVKVTGSIQNQRLVDYLKGMPGVDSLALLTKQIKTLASEEERAEVAYLIQDIRRAQFEYTRQCVTQNENNPFGPFVASTIINSLGFDSVDSLVAVFEKRMGAHKYVSALRNVVEQARPEYAAIQRLKAGAEAPDFELPSVDGRMVRLSSLRGKVVLLDFWASWCEASRNNNKTIVDAYRKFADKGIEIVGISIDTRPQNWRDAVKVDALPGIQLIDSTNVVAGVYRVGRTPSNVLIDAGGVIISRDEPFESLFSEIGDILERVTVNL